MRVNGGFEEQEGKKEKARIRKGKKKGKGGKKFVFAH